jgi:hypothetical protein
LGIFGAFADYFSEFPSPKVSIPAASMQWNCPTIDVLELL